MGAVWDYLARINVLFSHHLVLIDIITNDHWDRRGILLMETLNCAKDALSVQGLRAVSSRLILMGSNTVWKRKDGAEMEYF